MEQDFKKWLEEQTACWYLLSDKQYEWYLNMAMCNCYETWQERVSVILIISILSYLEVKKHHYGWDAMDYNGNVRKDLNYG